MYDLCLKELKSLIPDEEYKDILSQKYCELDGDFLGFIVQYKALSMAIPKEYIIIDFGCYVAPQAYFFKDHNAYIGIDTIPLKRFEPENCHHYIASIKLFFRGFVKQNRKKCFAICNYVNSKEVDLVKKHFENLFIFYPTINKQRSKNENV